MMLTFNNVTKEFRLDEENTITPVRNVSFKIEEGEFIVITGRSGTGKTTLLNLAAGLVKPTSGQVMIDKLDIGKMTDRQLSSLRSRKMGFIFQFPSLLPPLNIKDNVGLPSIFANGKGSKADEKAMQLLDTLGLASKAEVFPKQLSAGEQKRVVIARSLINQPSIILADEPTSDLDNRTEKEVMGILRDINATGVTFLIVTHNLELITFATRAFEMEDGNLNIIPSGVRQ
ncbi:MAG: ABC transporter ATP-binding protein [Dehalococcoidales bacterium]|nr:ABC transporter ATP-binding protein [Dehalococcoidales bacterium]